MTFKRAAYASTLAAGVGLAGLFGVGLGTAAADPGQQCNAPNQPQCGQNQHPNGNGNGNGPRNNNGPGNAPVNWQGRGVDQGRQDHQPFNWNGQQVTPMAAGNGAGWGFWFLGMWIPL
ncbi:hypothetical protein TUM20985_32160 [Mycobacterium antarcticum]|uniref:hypothetical protein n=1 Tax=unclassified Mycolicibacterium TaxID=2636767 RepID=UPI0023A3E24A|nr:MULTISPECIES: hypothetical protein [unclassified Mycolicibacterium]BDX32669.1 hypothetical protein TUM20985_32160 [Mycolicibacterium sp. TUM20985]GLP75876.1 hypothetical protein TUM20983_29860 [Mycolicibacterium sp. TUM20983]GLP83780.1 hypothetical protein TUM20984_52000 [Mycolicibacterium sp. TUM20984]